MMFTCATKRGLPILAVFILASLVTNIRANTCATALVNNVGLTQSQSLGLCKACVTIYTLTAVFPPTQKCVTCFSGASTLDSAIACLTASPLVITPDYDPIIFGHGRKMLKTSE